jgi:hypothetical protein
MNTFPRWFRSTAWRENSSGRFDLLAAIEAIDHVLGSVPEGLPVHIDRLLVVGLEHDPHLDIEHAVTPQENPARPARQHGAFEPGAVEAAAVDARDAARAIGCLPEHKDRYVECNRKQKFSGDPGHWSQSALNRQPF